MVKSREVSAKWRADQPPTQKRERTRKRRNLASQARHHTDGFSTVSPSEAGGLTNTIKSLTRDSTTAFKLVSSDYPDRREWKSNQECSKTAKLAPALDKASTDFNHPNDVNDCFSLSLDLNRATPNTPPSTLYPTYTSNSRTTGSHPNRDTGGFRPGS